MLLSRGPSPLALAAALGALAVAPAIAEAAFPGKNGRVAFDTRVGDRFDLFSIQPARGTGLRRVEDRAVDGTYSADGRRIAFGTSLGLVVADGDGSRPQAVPGTGGAFSPSFSPDGERLVFSSRVADDDVETVRLDGTERRRIATGRSPSWSPDGSLIAYEGFTPAGSRAIFTSRPDGTGAEAVPGTEGGTTPDFSPGATRLVFATAGDDIAVVPTEGGRARIVVRDRQGSEPTAPVYSPDGRSIAYGLRLGNGRGEVRVVSNRGGPVRRLTSGLRPSWQPR